MTYGQVSTFAHTVVMSRQMYEEAMASQAWWARQIAVDLTDGSRCSGLTVMGSRCGRTGRMAVVDVDDQPRRRCWQHLPATDLSRSL